MPDVMTTAQVPMNEEYERGVDQGRRQELLEIITIGLDQKFGAAGLKLAPVIGNISELQDLRTICQSLWNAEHVDQIQALIPKLVSDLA